MSATYGPITDLKAMGSAIMWARQLRGMNRDELAKELDVSPRTLGYVESGERPARATLVMGIAHVLNVPLEWLKNPPLPETFEVVESDSVANFQSGPYGGTHDDATHTNVVALADGSRRRASTEVAQLPLAN